LPAACLLPHMHLLPSCMHTSLHTHACLNSHLLHICCISSAGMHTFPPDLTSSSKNMVLKDAPSITPHAGTPVSPLPYSRLPVATSSSTPVQHGLVLCVALLRLLVPRRRAGRRGLWLFLCDSPTPLHVPLPRAARCHLSVRGGKNLPGMAFLGGVALLRAAGGGQGAGDARAYSSQFAAPAARTWQTDSSFLSRHFYTRVRYDRRWRYLRNARDSHTPAAELRRWRCARNHSLTYPPVKQRAGLLPSSLDAARLHDTCLTTATCAPRAHCLPHLTPHTLEWRRHHPPLGGRR